MGYCIVFEYIFSSTYAKKPPHMTFPLFFHDGHPLVQSSPDLILLDTGSPLSFQDTGILR